MAEDNNNHLLDTFSVLNSSDSIVSTSENEGTNASRFAILGSLNTGRNRAYAGLEQEIARLGFERTTIRRSQQLGRGSRRIEDRLLGVQALRQYENWWDRIEVDLSEMRSRAWWDINHDHLEARIALLTAGLCSHLERESAVAAAALIGNLRVAIAGNPRRSSQVRRFWVELYESDVDHSVWPNYLWPYLGLREGEGSGEFGGELPLILPWSQQNWSSITKLIFQRATRRFGDDFSFLHILSDVAWIRIKLAENSADLIVRQFPHALFLQRWRTKHRGRFTEIPTYTHALPLQVHSGSTMVHGTFSRHYPEDWWQIGSTFDAYQTQNYRNCIDQNAPRFIWNGRYSERARMEAGVDLRKWISRPSSRDSLCTVYAHSCGAEVVAHAVNSGSQMNEVVLLSAPINKYIEKAIPEIGRVYDVRLGFDMVLLLAQFAQNLFGFDEHQFPTQISKLHSYRYFGVKNFWFHGITHDETFWTSQNIAQKIHI